MWNDEREEHLQQIREDLAGLAVYTLVWAVLFAIVCVVML